MVRRGNFIPVAWGVSLTRLAALDRPDRLNKYSAKVVKLKASEEEAQLHEVLVNTNFRRLNKIEVEASEDTSDRELLHYLQPQLRHIRIDGGDLSDDFLRNVQASMSP